MTGGPITSDSAARASGAGGRECASPVREVSGRHRIGIGRGNRGVHRRAPSRSASPPPSRPTWASPPARRSRTSEVHRVAQRVGGLAHLAQRFVGGIAELLLEPARHLLQLGVELSELAHRLGQLLGTEHDEGQEQDDDQLTALQVEHAGSLGLRVEDGSAPIEKAHSNEAICKARRVAPAARMVPRATATSDSARHDDHVRPPRRQGARTGEHVQAFRLALEMGATGLESDVWLTADGVPVLDHDGVLGRRMRRRRIAELRRDELPDHIPTLADLIDACGTDYHLSLDLKAAQSGQPVIDAVGVPLERAAGADMAVSPGSGDPRRAAARQPATSSSSHSTRLARLGEGAERHAGDARRRRHRLRQPAPRRLERGPGHAVPPLRACRVRLGHAVRARAPRRRCGWAATASTATGSTGWSRPTRRRSPGAALIRLERRSTTTASRLRPEDDERPPDDVVDRDRTQRAAVGRAGPVVAHHEHVVLRHQLRPELTPRRTGDDLRIEVGLDQLLRCDGIARVLVDEHLAIADLDRSRPAARSRA